jgi:hypothetical protein
MNRTRIGCAIRGITQDGTTFSSSVMAQPCPMSSFDHLENTSRSSGRHRPIHINELTIWGLGAAILDHAQLMESLYALVEGVCTRLEQENVIGTTLVHGWEAVKEGWERDTHWPEP